MCPSRCAPLAPCRRQPFPKRARPRGLPGGPARASGPPADQRGCVAAPSCPLGRCRATLGGCAGCVFGGSPAQRLCVASAAHVVGLPGTLPVCRPPAALPDGPCLPACLPQSRRRTCRWCATSSAAAWTWPPTPSTSELFCLHPYAPSPTNDGCFCRYTLSSGRCVISCLACLTFAPPAASGTASARITSRPPPSWWTAPRAASASRCGLFFLTRSPARLLCLAMDAHRAAAATRPPAPPAQCGRFHDLSEFDSDRR